MGENKVLLEMGHFNCEELGMRYCLQWLPEALSEKLPLIFLPAGDLFDYIVR